MVIRSTRIPGNAGFTVVELMLSIAVFALIFPALMNSVLLNANLNNRAEDLVYSNILAENKFESLRSKGYNSISNGTVNFTTELDNTLGSPRSATYTVSSYSTGVKQIDLTITYTDRGKTITESYVSLISELGVAQ